MFRLYDILSEDEIKASTSTYNDKLIKAIQFYLNCRCVFKKMGPNVYRHYDLLFFGEQTTVTEKIRVSNKES